MAGRDQGSLASGSPARAGELFPGDPRRLGSYRIVGRLGQGGMGTVYLAETPEGRPVAVKMVRVDLAADDGFRRRFRSEVERARQVPPFCTAEVLDADPDHEPPYLVVEYVDGPSLADVVEQRGPLTAGNLHGLAIGVATALSAIHGAGVIHRDLKPRNVLLPPGTPKVIDFGIARALESATRHTRTDHMVGTVAYMAPERFGPGDASVTAAADIFAWGAVVAYAGTGRTPFDADSAVATATRILTQPPDLDGLTGPLRDLVADALRKEPTERPTARELLDRLLNTSPQSAPTTVAFAAQPTVRHAAQRAPATTRVVPAARDWATTAPRPDRTPAAPPRDRVPDAPPRQGSRRWTVVALLSTVAAGAALLAAPQLFQLVTGGGRPPTVTAADPPAAPSTVQTTPSESAPSQSAEPEPPAPSAEPKPPPRAPFRFAENAAVADRLTKPGDFADFSTDEGSCRFAKALVVTVTTEEALRCGATGRTFAGDHRISVEVSLRTAGSCATVWFFSSGSGDGEYRINLCAHAYILSWQGQDARFEQGRLVLSKRTPLNKAHRVTIDIRGKTVRLARDGETVGVLPLKIEGPGFAGNVLLGGAGEAAGGEAPYRVALRNLEIIEGSP